MKDFYIKNIGKISSLIVVFILFSLPLVTTAFTLEFDPDVKSSKSGSISTISDVLSTRTQLGDQNPAQISYEIINWALIFLGLITTVMIIVGGFMWLFAAGNEDKIQKAQQLIKGALIGLAIIMSAYGIAQYVFNQIVTITT